MKLGGAAAEEICEQSRLRAISEKSDSMKPDEVFDNLPTIIGRKPRTLADFAQKHADNSGTKTRNFHEH
jgi:hypothetical protein